MNLEEWLEKMKDKPYGLIQQCFLPLRVCDICGKIKYNRKHREKNVVYLSMGEEIICTACMEKGVRGAKRRIEEEDERDPWAINDWDFPTMSDYAPDSFVSISPVHHKVVHKGDEYDFKNTLYINKKGDVKPVYRDWQKEKTRTMNQWKNEEEWLLKQGRVLEALDLMEEHFNELRTLL